MSKSKTTTPSPIVVELNQYKAELIKEAELIVLEEFPKKVIEFNNMLKEEKFKYERVPDLLPDADLNIPVPVKKDGVNLGNIKIKAENGSDEQPSKKKRRIVSGDGEGDTNELVVVDGLPVYGFANGTVSCNAKLAELMDEVRPKLRDAVELVNKVKMWITFLIPRIEDGNNFGVGIQEETLNEVSRVEGEAASFLDQISRYFVSRAKLITKVAKYPHVDDYRRAILDMDEKQFINIRLVLTEMRNHFATLHDMITKNLEKIKKPRSSNMESMY